MRRCHGLFLGALIPGLLIGAASGGAAAPPEGEAAHLLEIDTPDPGYLHLPVRILDRSTHEASSFDPSRDEPAAIGYHLTRDGLIRLRVVWRHDERLVLRTLLDWTRQEFGRHEVRWDGRDASGHLVDNRACRIDFRGDDPAHLRHDPADCHELAVELEVPDPGLTITDLSQIRGRILRDTAFGRRDGFRLRAFVDGVLALESELPPGSDAFTLAALPAPAAGEHTVVVNVDDGRDHVGVASARIRYSQPPALRESGRELFADKGCSVCHELTVADFNERGPGLLFIGSRRPVDYLRRVVADPRSLNRTSGMPREALTAAELDLLVSYLASLRREPGAGRSGRQVYFEEGCGDCHEAVDPAQPMRGPALGAMMRLRTAAYLEEVIVRPQEGFPGTAMPPLRIAEEELAALIDYLQRP